MSVEQDLLAIMQARYGRDVRQAIHDSIYDINNVALQAEGKATTAQNSASAYANASLQSERRAQQYMQQAQQYAEQAMSDTPTGYEQVVSDVYSIKTESNTVLSKVGTVGGRCLLNKMYGMSVQEDTPTISVPADFTNAKANFKNSGKNLNPYPYQDTTVTRNEVTFTDNGDGTITANGTPTTGQNGNFYIHNGLNNYIELEQGTYKISGCPSGGAGNKYFIRVRDLSTNPYTTLADDYGNGATFTLTQRTKIAIYLSIIDGTTATNLLFKPMLTLEGADQSFESYSGKSITTDIVLRAIEVSSEDNYNLVKDGKYYIADELRQVEGGYKIIRNIGAKTIDNTMNPYLYGINEHGFGSWQYIFSSYFSDIIFNGLAWTTNKMLRHIRTSRFIGSTVPLADVENNSFTVSGSILFIRADTSIVGTTNEEFKAWTGDNNIEVYYVKTPTEESVSDENAQLLYSFVAFDSSTYIAQVEDVLGVLEVEYPTSEMASKALSGYVIAEQNASKIHELTIAVMEMAGNE